MKIKTTIQTFLLLIVFVAFASQGIFAQVTPNPTRAAIRQERQVQRITLRRDRADQEIMKRITALNGLINRINAMKKLTASQKSSLTSQLNTEIANLQTLKAKIDGDTDLQTLTADKKSVVDSFRVYALFMPKISILAYADRILDIVNDLKAKNPTGDALTKVNDAQTQAQNAINTVLPLDPSGYPGNKTQLVAARSMLKTANQDVRAAWAEMRKATVNK